MVTMMTMTMTAPSLPTATAAAADGADDDEYGLEAFLGEYCTRRFGPGVDRDWLVVLDDEYEGRRRSTAATPVLQDEGGGGGSGNDAETADLSNKSIRSFVNELDLPRIHPWCHASSLSLSGPLLTTTKTPLDLPPSSNPGRGGARTIDEAIATILYQSVPPRWAFVQLWVRYIGGPAALFGLLWLVVCQFKKTLRASRRSGGRGKRQRRHDPRHNPIHHSSVGNAANLDDKAPTIAETQQQQCDAPFGTAIVTVACSYIVMVDAMYQYEYGIRNLQWFFAVACAIAAAQTLSWSDGVHVCRKARSALSSVGALSHGRRLLIVAGLAALLATSFSDVAVPNQPYYYDENEPVQIEPGLYYNQNNSLLHRAITQHWPPHKRTYTSANATMWMHTGDARTGIPYYLNYVPNLDWKSVFLTVRSETNISSNITNSQNEVVLELAFSFPSEGHDTSKPLYLVLHGMNGGTTDGYIRDLAWRRNRAGSTVVVMVARGFMGSPLAGTELFHGARWSDVHAASVALRKALGPDQLLVGVGYSMGAIVVANYAVRSGSDCALDAAIAISGALECRVEQNYTRAQKLWQPMIAALLRLSYFDRFLPQLASKLSPSEIVGYQRATHVVGLDQYTSAIYNGYTSLQPFYSDMGALGDIPLSEMDRPNVSSLTTPPHLVKLSIPLLVLHALDDPLSTWRTVAANSGIMHPRSLVQASNNLVMLLTEKGGHVGWPLGWRPHRRGWEFMNDVASGFAEAIVKAKLDSDKSGSKDELATQTDDDGDDELEDVGVCDSAPTIVAFDPRAASTLIRAET